MALKKELMKFAKLLLAISLCLTSCSKEQMKKDEAFINSTETGNVEELFVEEIQMPKHPEPNPSRKKPEPIEEAMKKEDEEPSEEEIIEEDEELGYPPPRPKEYKPKPFSVQQKKMENELDEISRDLDAIKKATKSKEKHI